MKTLSRVMWMVCLLAFVGCTAAQVASTASTIKDGAGIAAQAVGAANPLGLILGAVGAVAGVIASLAGAHAVAGANAAGVDPHPVSNFLTNHLYIYPLISSVLTALNPYVFHLTPDHLSTIVAMLGVPFGVQAIGSQVAAAATPAATDAPAAPKT